MQSIAIKNKIMIWDVKSKKIHSNHDFLCVLKFQKINFMAIMIFLHVLMTKKYQKIKKFQQFTVVPFQLFTSLRRLRLIWKRELSTNRNIQSLLQFIFIHSSHGNAQVIKDAICNTCSIPQVLCCALQKKEKEI